jgi:hypothetical protein
MKISIISAAFMAIMALFTKDKLTGRWETQPSPKGNVTGVVFKADNSFEGYVNKKPFVTGTYTLKDSTFTFTDSGCEGAVGVYKLIFFHNADSLRFQPISDTCSERRNGISRMVLGRVRKVTQ